MALIEKLNALGDAVRGKTKLTEKMTLDQMAEAINNLEVNPAPNVEEITIVENGTYTPNEGVDGFNKVIVEVPVDLPKDLLHLTGDQQYRFYGSSWSSFIERYGNQITTENLTVMSYMFSKTSVKEIPFSLNVKPNINCDVSSLFGGAGELEYLPIISNCKIGSNGLKSMCNNCYNLKEINIDFDNWDLSNVANSVYAPEGEWHANCYSLRKIPMNYYNKLSQIKTAGKTYYFYSIYYCLAQNCYNIDEIIDMPVMILDTYTSNAFYQTITNTYRLKDFTFKIQEDGTPYVANWKSQVIDLSTSGYCQLSGTYMKRDNYLYNSGITINKCIYDDATYQALKNDPDNYVCGYSNENPHHYSHYDKASAIRTINSLPDVSSSGGTNTIKFKGEAGLKTDGGAINTMAPEEIAVATARGWTVSFV